MMRALALKFAQAAVNGDNKKMQSTGNAVLKYDRKHPMWSLTASPEIVKIVEIVKSCVKKD